MADLSYVLEDSNLSELDFNEVTDNEMDISKVVEDILRDDNDGSKSKKQTMPPEVEKACGAVAERLRYCSREQKVPSSSPRSDISVEVTSQC